MDPDKPLTEVTEEERLDVCEAADEYSLEQTTAEENCLYDVLSVPLGYLDELAELSTEELRQQCREQVEFCMEAKSGQFVLNACWGTEPCPAHVGDFEECLISLSDRLAEVVSELPSCDELTLDWLVDNEALLEPGALGTSACDQLTEECGWARLPEDEGAGGAAGAASE